MTFAWLSVSAGLCVLGKLAGNGTALKAGAVMLLMACMFAC